ncbi:unnamed protein product [Somion occarium]|uniref:F-box domain-containing protein n=1 Tax=Somion occarium TaxID=3059160 RepID=A0ABP1E1B1_9APHY
MYDIWPYCRGIRRRDDDRSMKWTQLDVGTLRHLMTSLPHLSSLHLFKLSVGLTVDPNFGTLPSAPPAALMTLPKHLDCLELDTILFDRIEQRFPEILQLLDIRELRLKYIKTSFNLQTPTPLSNLQSPDTLSLDFTMIHVSCVRFLLSCLSFDKVLTFRLEWSATDADWTPDLGPIVQKMSRSLKHFSLYVPCNKTGVYDMNYDWETINDLASCVHLESVTVTIPISTPAGFEIARIQIIAETRESAGISMIELRGIGLPRKPDDFRHDSLYLLPMDLTFRRFLPSVSKVVIVWIVAERLSMREWQLVVRDLEFNFNSLVRAGVLRIIYQETSNCNSRDYQYPPVSAM